MTTGWKIGLACVAVYLAVPVVKRVQSGCPAFAGLSKTVPLTGGGTTTVQACKPLTVHELLLWPAGMFFRTK